MKQLFENWRKFVLSEKLMLKPGPNGWDKYCELVAAAYQSAPRFDPAAVASFEAMTPFVEKMFKRIESVVDIQFVEEHPYENAEELRQDVQQNGVLRISTLDAEHDIFDPATNAKFRAIHDFMSHIQRNTNFDAKGEIASYNAHLQTMPPKSYPALFTEVVGQACTSIITGKFPEQKIALLSGFDYVNIGVVEGYDIVNKELVKSEESN
jgi:hypothetical protein|tara:strand:+ start:1866 stop:2492 length:627 start_codon:yes stop_codon:yes gene_type:complete